MHLKENAARIVDLFARLGGGGVLEHPQHPPSLRAWTLPHYAKMGHSSSSSEAPPVPAGSSQTHGVKKSVIIRKR